jgi:hypothetical protein
LFPKLRHRSWRTIVAVGAASIVLQACQPLMHGRVARTSACRARDDTADYVAFKIALMLESPTGRTGAGLPAVRERDIHLVTDNDGLCRRVIAELPKALPGTPSERFSGRIYLYQVGNTFVAHDPSYYYRDPGWPVFLVFSADFKHRSTVQL